MRIVVVLTCLLVMVLAVGLALLLIEPVEEGLVGTVYKVENGVVWFRVGHTEYGCRGVDWVKGVIRCPLDRLIDPARREV